jgi:tetratricopeptide (TPR) repeat protein
LYKTVFLKKDEKDMRHILAITIAALFLLFPSHAFTQVKEIVSEGSYNMGDGETPTVAESRALLNAKRVALEQAGTYVESYTKVENVQLTKDEIQVLASGIMEVEILDKKRTIVGDGFRFWVKIWVKIKARVNPDNIKEMAKKVKEKSVVEDYKKIQEAYEKSQKDIEELKKQLAQAKGEEEKKKVEEKISDDERIFQANEWVEKGKKYLDNKEYGKAIDAYTSAIAFNSNYADAYKHRGLTYIASNQVREIFFFDKADKTLKKDFDIIDSMIILYNKAIEDYKKARSINPDDKLINTFIVDALTGMGSLYSMRGQYKIAIEYHNKAIAIDPTNASIYISRGGVYGSSGQLNMAIEDFNKAIILNHNFAGSAIYSRGIMYFDNDQVDRAISDWQKACDIGYKMACKALKALQNR